MMMIWGLQSVSTFNSTYLKVPKVLEQTLDISYFMLSNTYSWICLEARCHYKIHYEEYLNIWLYRGIGATVAQLVGQSAVSRDNRASQQSLYVNQVETAHLAYLIFIRI